VTDAKRARGKTKHAKTKPSAVAAGAASSGTPAALPDMAAAGVARPGKCGPKASSTSTEAEDLIKQICSTTVRGARDYSAVVIAFARANTVSAVDLAHQLSKVTSPLEFMKLSNEHNRRHFEALTTQAKALAEIARKLTREAAEPVKAAVAKGRAPGV
jgi:hypothetical protein